MLVNRGEIIIEPDSTTINNYPFNPSIVYKRPKILVSDIINLDIKSVPPTIKVGSELIFLLSVLKDKLLLFSGVNHIPIVEREDIWSWI